MAEYRSIQGVMPARESPYFIPRPKLFSPDPNSHFIKNPAEVMGSGRRENTLVHSPIRSSNQSGSSNHTSFSFPASVEQPISRQPIEKSPPHMMSAVPKDIQSGLQRIKETQQGLLSELRAETLRGSVRPYSKISEESHRNFESSRRDDDSALQKRKLEAELSVKMKRIEQLLYSQRELQKAVHDLKAELQSRRSEKTIEQIPNNSEGPLLDRYQQDVVFYRAESEKLMAENVKLKKELLMRETDSYDKTSKSAQQIPEVCSFSLNDKSKAADYSNTSVEYANLMKAFDENNIAVQNELKKITEGARLAPIEKEQFAKLIQRYEQSRLKVVNHIRDEVSSQAVVETLVRSKQNLQQLNRLKERLVESLRRNDGNYEFLQIQAEYQTTFFRIASELENLKHKVAIESKQQRKQKQKQQNFWQLKQSNEHLTNEVVSLKKYIQNENQSKSKFLQQLDKSNSVNKSVFQQNEQLKKQLQLLRRRSLGRQDSLKALGSVNEQKDDLKRENSQLQKQILGLSQKLQDAVRITSKGNVQFLERQIKDRDERIIQLQEEIERLNKQMDSFRSEVEGTRSTVKQLQSTINNLSHEIEQKQRYASELEASLAPIKPKKPFILNKSMDDKQQQLKERLMQLTNQTTRLSKLVAQLEMQLEQTARRERQLRQGSQNKQGLLKERIEELQARVADLQSEINNDRLVHDTSIKKYQTRISELENNTTSFQEFKRDHMSSYQRQMSKLLTLTAENETRIRSEHTQELSQIQTRYDQERNQYMTIIRQLADQKQKLEEEFQIRERDLMNKEINNEKEISRITAQNEALKRSVEAQIDKLSRANSEHSKTMIQKYEKDIVNLTKTNQILLNDNKIIPGLQMQLNNQLSLIRQLQACIKDKSMVVDHLWQIKKVEYDNMLRQLKKLQSLNH